eukprot:Rhum_TRINITY_DN14960_c21_g2::Rhum_TRINITY_DN14960_c21_g2_i1::g.130488::m.130488
MSCEMSSKHCSCDTSGEYTLSKVNGSSLLFSDFPPMTDWCPGTSTTCSVRWSMPSGNSKCVLASPNFAFDSAGSTGRTRAKTRMLPLISTSELCSSARVFSPIISISSYSVKRLSRAAIVCAMVSSLSRTMPSSRSTSSWNFWITSSYSSMRWFASLVIVWMRVSPSARTLSVALFCSSTLRFSCSTACSVSSTFSLSLRISASFCAASSCISAPIRSIASCASLCLRCSSSSKLLCISSDRSSRSATSARWLSTVARSRSFSPFATSSSDGCLLTGPVPFFAPPAAVRDRAAVCGPGLFARCAVAGVRAGGAPVPPAFLFVLTPRAGGARAARADSCGSARPVEESSGSCLSSLHDVSSAASCRDDCAGDAATGAAAAAAGCCGAAAAARGAEEARPVP